MMVTGDLEKKKTYPLNSKRKNCISELKKNYKWGIGEKNNERHSLRKLKRKKSDKESWIKQVWCKSLMQKGK